MSPTHDSRTIDLAAGDLRHHLVVQSKARQAVGSRGQAVPTEGAEWGADSGSYPGIPASLLGLAGKKLEIARQLVPTATHEIVTRWFPGMSTKKRFKLGDRVFAIGHMLNVLEMNAKLMFTCTEDQSTETSG